MILITGGTGFLGHHLVRRLLGAGKGVRCLVRSGSPGVDWLRTQPAELVPGHLLDASAVARACQGSQKIIHLAAPIHEGRDAVVEHVQLTGMKHLIEGARAAGVERILMISPLGSGASAGLPFLRSRGMAEDRLRESGLPFVVLQSSLMFGAGDRLISNMARLLQRLGMVVIPGTGKAMLQPIWVGDVVSCFVRALEDEEALDRTIPVGGPQHLTYEEIAEQVGKMLNVAPVKIHLSRRMAGWLGRALEGLGQSPFLGYRHLELLEVGTITALDAVKRSFGFQPMPLVEGVAYHILPPREMGAGQSASGAGRGSRGSGRR